MPITLLTKNTGVIKAFHDVTLYHQFRGPNKEEISRGGVFKDIGDELSITTSNANKTATIGTGMALLYGRQFSLDAPEILSFSALTGINYIIIYIEINTYNVTNERITLKYATSGGFYPILTNENIYTKKTGIAVLPLYQLVYNATTSTFTTNDKVYKLLAPGVDEETEYLPNNATINTREIGNLLSPDNPLYFRDATETEKSNIAYFLQKTKTPLTKGEVSPNLTLVGRGTKLLTVGPPLVLTPTEWFSETGIITAPAWKPQVEYEHTFPTSLKSTSQSGSLSFYIIDIKMSAAVWRAGVLGIGSHWEYIFQDKVTSVIARPGQKIFVVGAHLGNARKFGTSSTVYAKDGPPLGNDEANGIFRISMPNNQDGIIKIGISDGTSEVWYNGFGIYLFPNRCRVFGSITVRQVFIGGQA